ncbi:TolC family protein [Pseudomonas guariconensis]|uniref:TolC family protein n=1 Tax=Pseudomonas guariconensis TaxID=1288410 RepID=UPI0018AB5693|nr:TolC family protein [Pseudomonas guariconensis]MBF8742052.1 TolC family protein [Pseudomonas guariconensis]MBF8749783.1 TolC family protein [Pseudomonas guariconensis]
MRSFLLVLTLSMTSGLAHGQLLTLQELLDRQQDTPLARAGAADLRALQAEAKLHEDRAGWQVFAGASAGRFEELVTEDIRDDYYGRNLNLGVRHPLLGSLNRQLELLENNQYEQQRQQMRQALERSSRRLALRSAYADWWRAQQELALCRSLKAGASDAAGKIRMRREKGWLRDSQAQLRLSEWQVMTQRCDGLPQLEADIRADLALLSGQPIPEGAQATAEPLALAPEPLDRWQAVLGRHPRISEKQNLLAQADAQRDSPWYNAIDSDVILAGSKEYRSGSDKSGSGLLVALNFSMPFDVVGNSRARKQLAQARYDAASERLEAERQTLGLELNKALRAQRAGQLTLEQRRQQRSVVAQALEEEKRRNIGGGDDGFDGQLMAQRLYYQSGLDLIAAWHAAWLRQANLDLLLEDAPQADQLLGRERQQWTTLNDSATSLTLAAAPPLLPLSVVRDAPTRTAGWSQGIYVWNSAALLDPHRRPAELQALQQAGMQKIYLGLDAAQVRNLPTTRQALEQLLAQASGQGLQVSLLLGDPSWIEPAQRHELMSLVKKLDGLAFDSLHLDLEVEQLGWPVPEQRLRDWLDTLKAAVQASPWPVEIASHPRWFDPTPPSKTCVPCALPGIGVHQVSLMIYTSNSERSTQRASTIAKRWPDLRLRLAQSVEPHLSKSESWAGQPPERLQQQVAQWRKDLSPQGIVGIDWQAWADYPKR